MGDAQTITAAGSEPQLQRTEAGIVGFYAEHTASKDYQAEKFGITFAFPEALSYVDAIEHFGEVQAQAAEQAQAALQQRLAQRQAQVAQVTGAAAPAPQPAPSPAPQQAAPPQAPHPVASPEPAPQDVGAIIEVELDGQLQTVQQPGGMPVAVGTTPKGSQLRYVPTSALDEQALRQAIEAKIRESGFDPGDFVVFDNRVSRDGSPYPGLEDGGKSYQVVTIRARNDTPWQAVVGDKTQVFYADFDEQGRLQFKVSDKLNQAAAAARAFAPAS